ncbi:MAG: hypothetical protein OEN01_07830 [Candidatus Krumholzibacteria bacterium]|nr:hypothetical protein [Candidatus Krumholzibacteria bacterium]
MTDNYQRVLVECYAGFRGEEEPRRFTWNDHQRDVVEILDRWLDPNHRYFKVRACDQGIYILRHDADTGPWEVSVFLEGNTI